MIEGLGTKIGVRLRVFDKPDEQGSGSSGETPSDQIAKLIQQVDENPRHMPHRLSLARAYMEANQPQNAIPVVLYVCDRHPDWPWASALLIDAYVAAGQYDYALETAEAALDITPGFFKICIQKCEILEKFGRRQDAIESILPFYGEAGLKPFDALKLAQAFRRFGKRQEAQTTLSEALKETPDHEGLWMAMLNLILEHPDLANAAETAEQAMEHCPENARVCQRAIKVLQESGKADKALGSLERLSRANPDDQNVSLAYADALLNAGDTTSADEVAVRVVETHPDSTWARMIRVQIAERSGDVQAALEHLENPAAQDGKGGHLPKDPKSLVRYAQLAVRRGDQDRMLAVGPALGRVVGDLPNRMLIFLLRMSRTFVDQDLAGHILTEILKRTDLDAPLAAQVFRWGCVICDEDQLEALQARLKGNVAEADRSLFEMDATLLRAGPEEAFHHTRAILKSTRSVEETIRMGRITHWSGRAGLAARYLRKAMRRWPPNFELLETLIDALVDRGDVGGAHSVLGSVTDLYGENELDELRIRILIAQGDLQDALDLSFGLEKRDAKAVSHIRNLRMQVSLGDLEGASMTIRKGNLNDQGHFRITQTGAMFNELQIFYSARNPDDEITEQDVMGFYHPAQRIVDAADPDALSHGADPSPIVRKIVQYWDTPDIPKPLADLMQTWQDVPGWSYRCFDRRAALEWLRQTFGNVRVRAFRLAKSPTEEADFFRLCYLEAEGGLYVDADDKRIDDPEKLLHGTAGAVVFRELFRSIANNLIYAPPGHPLISMAARMVQRSLLARENDSTWSKSGPGLMTRATALFLMKRQPDTPHQLTILPQHEMQRAVYPHTRVPHKYSSKYWNAQVSDLPESVKSILQLRKEGVVSAPPAKKPDMFEQRMSAFASRLEEAGLDAALITDEDNVYYLTGYYDYLHMEFGRPTILIVTREGESLLVTPSIDFNAAKSARVDRIAPWNDGMGDEWRAELPRALQGLKRIGLEPNQMPPMVRAYVDTLTEPEKVSSVTPILSQMRMIKSAEELQLARHAGLVANAMMVAGRAALGDGVPEYEVALATAQAGTRKAADLLETHYSDQDMSPNTHFLQIMATGDAITKTHHRASTRIMRRGEPAFLCFCGMTNFHRFKLGFDRTFWIGEMADPSQASVYEVALASQQAALKALRPGVTAESIHAEYAEVIQGAGYDYPFRCGRATGFSFLESPQLVTGDKTVLQPGMVFAVDGSVTVENFRAQVGDSFIITEDGYEPITDHPKGLDEVVV